MAMRVIFQTLNFLILEVPLFGFMLSSSPYAVTRYLRRKAG